MNYFLILISVIFSVTKNMVSKSGRDIFSGIKGLFKTNIITAVTGLVIFGFKVTFVHLDDMHFILLAFLYGTLTMMSQTFYIFATKDGSLSVCSLMYSCGFIIPTLFAAIAYNESLSALKIIGILLLVSSIFTVTGKIKGNGKILWLIPAFLSMLSSGIVGVIQKIFTKTYSGAYYNEFLFCAFAIMLVISVVVIISNQIKPVKAVNVENRTGIKAFILPAVFSICIVMCNKLNLYLTGIVDGVIFFPCYNGSVIAFSALFSSLFFKEKLTALKKAGIASSVISIILIALS